MPDVPPDPRKDIAALRAAYSLAIAERRADLMEQYLDPDLVVLAGPGAVRVGRKAVIANHQANEFRDPAFAGYERITDEVILGNDPCAAIERGHWRACFVQEDGTIDGASGHFQAGWIRSGGQWRIRTEAYVRLDPPARGLAC